MCQACVECWAGAIEQVCLPCDRHVRSAAQTATARGLAQAWSTKRVCPPAPQGRPCFWLRCPRELRSQAWHRFARRIRALQLEVGGCGNRVPIVFEGAHFRLNIRETKRRAISLNVPIVAHYMPKCCKIY